MRSRKRSAVKATVGVVLTWCIFLGVWGLSQLVDPLLRFIAQPPKWAPYALGSVLLSGVLWALFFYTDRDSERREQ